jgi:D-aminopeptidase
MKPTQKRIRDFGLIPGLLPAGPKNLLSDVPGVTVGHYTVNKRPNVHTGVTVVDPGVDAIYRNKLPAAIAVGNGYGKLAGYTQVAELGTLETPIALTNTLAVGPVMRGVIDVVLAGTPDLLPYETINAVVGETNDGLVNDIHELHIASEDVRTAYEARRADFALGAVGAGTGTRAFSWKGGIGSSSRVVEYKGKPYTIGALVQTNFGGALTVMGVPVGERLGETDFNGSVQRLLQRPDGSCMIVIATDTPMDSRQLKRLAKRALIGMTRTGSIMANSSGDYAIAFSTNRNPGAVTEDDNDLNKFFLAAAEATEESIYDALFLAEETVGDRATLPKLPVEQVVEMIRETRNG